MKISKLERVTLSLTALAVAFMAGWFLCRQHDARQAFVPPAAQPAVSQAVSPAPSPDSGADVPEKININTATAQELTALPGIGEKRAADIVAFREANGPFPVPEALTDVPGIGQATFEQIAGRITVED